MRKYLRGTEQERFDNRVVMCPMSGCWLWDGAVNWGGYGRMMVKGKSILAHRWSYENTNGPIPDGMDVDHKCRNRSCVNPDHLRLATRSENMANTKTHADGQSGLKGVDYHRGTGKWRARVQNAHLGLFDTPEEAHKAYCEEGRRIWGEYFID